MFEFVGRVDGRVTFRRLAAATKSEAVTEARGLTTDRDRGELRARPTAPTVPELRDEFLDHLRSLVGDPDDRRRRSQACVDLYERHLDVRFVPEFRTRRVDEITTADLRRWLDKLRRTKLAPNTQRGVLTAASAMLRYAAKQAYIPMSPAAGLDRDDRPSTTRKRQPRYLNGAQLGALLDDSRRLSAPGAMLAYAGLRVSEALAVRWRDLDLDAGRLPSRATRPGRAHGAAQDHRERGDRRPPPRARPRAPRTPCPTSGSRHSPLRADALVFSTRTGSLTINAARYGPSRRPRGPQARARHRARPPAFARRERARRRTHAGRGRAACAAPSPAVTASVYADVLESNRETLGAKLVQAGFGA